MKVKAGNRIFEQTSLYSVRADRLPVSYGIVIVLFCAGYLLFSLHGRKGSALYIKQYAQLRREYT
jgi:hypothetical protein